MASDKYNGSPRHLAASKAQQKAKQELTYNHPEEYRELYVKYKKIVLREYEKQKEIESENARTRS